MRYLDTVAGAAGAFAKIVATVVLAIPAGLVVATDAFAQGTDTPVSVKPDLANGKKIATSVCASCHGPDGNSTAPVNPKLAAQHTAYLQKQLADFKVQEGAKTASRASAIMGPLVVPLSPQDMLDVAAYYHGQPYKPSVAREKELVDLGRDVYRSGIASKGVPACAGCHGATGSGIPSQYPRLNGQYAEYTAAQLVAFGEGKRQNNAAMSSIAARLSDREIKAVSDYMAGLR